MKYKTKMGLVRGGDLLAIDKELITEIKIALILLMLLAKWSILHVQDATI